MDVGAPFEAGWDEGAAAARTKPCWGYCFSFWCSSCAWALDVGARGVIRRQGLRAEGDERRG